MQHRLNLKNHTLINQYNILNQCLQLINKSKVKTVTKLRMETKLIMIKRLLLNEQVLDRTRCASCGEELLEGLLLQMRRISSGICSEEAIAEFLQRARGVVNALGGDNNMIH